LPRSKKAFLAIKRTKVSKGIASPDLFTAL